MVTSPAGVRSSGFRPAPLVAAVIVLALGLTSGCADATRSTSNPANGTGPNRSSAADKAADDLKSSGIASDGAGSADDDAIGAVIEIDSRTGWTPDADAEASRFRDLVMMNAAIEGWTDPATASKAGFRPMPLDANHWFNPDFVNDGRTFDPVAPEFLIVAQGRVLGAMFLADSAELDQPDPPGSPLIRWHYHEYDRPMCYDGTILIDQVDSDGSCPSGQIKSTTTPPMVHVWFVDMDDPFDSEMDAELVCRLFPLDDPTAATGDTGTRTS